MKENEERTARALNIIDRLTASKAINIRERGTLRCAILLPEREQGEWVDVEGAAHLSKCNKCWHMIDRRIEEGYPNFCAECGADMRQD